MAEEKEAPRKVSRREFVKGAAVGAAGVAGAGALASCAPASSPTTAPWLPEKWDYETDVVVAGAGNGGMCGAVSAAKGGAKTILLEMASKTGGGSAWSGGYIHCMGLQTWEEYLEYTEGLHDPELGKLYVETYRNEYIPWLTEIGAYFQRDGSGPAYMQDYVMGKGEPGQLKHRLYFDSLEEILTASGGTILAKTRALKLLTDEEGRVVGLRASSWETSPLEKDQKAINIKAKAVILCTGNFFNNHGLNQQFIGPYADMARPMGVPYATGAGILMAQEVGAALSRSMSTWSGTLCAITPTKVACGDPEAYEKALAETSPEMLGAALYSGLIFAPSWISLIPAMGAESSAILVNLDGKRFMDEASPVGSKYVRAPQTVLNQRDGMAFMIGDKAIYDQAPDSEAVIGAITTAGGNVVTADTIEEFAAKLEELRVYKANFLRTVEEYNKAIDEENAAELDPPRTAGLNKISTPPFYAIPVTVAIYYNMGGLAINKDAEVIDMQGTAIPGLYASSPPAGGIMNTIYTGGIGIAGTFGYIAGRSAGAYVKS